MKNLITMIIFGLIGLNILNANATIHPYIINHLEEVADSNEIPFNTKEVVEDYFLLPLELEEETYIDDSNLAPGYYVISMKQNGIRSKGMKIIKK